MEDLTGKQFGPYPILEPIGQGGMGAVYKSFQANMNRPVAIKTLPRQLAEDPNFAGRFRQEAVLLASLQHPHILPVFDFGECDGYAYLVMPFIKSGTLRDLLAGGPLPLQKIREFITQIGGALDYAHSHGLIHRDVKPSNVLMDESGNCLLMDFGLAKMFESSHDFTTTGGILGTPAYMSPEQGRGEVADRRSDVYALGVMLFEMATGRLPYNAESAIALIYQHIHDPLPMPRLANPRIPAAVEKVILKALAKDPASRYPTAGDLVRALQQAIPENAGEAKEAAQSGRPMDFWNRLPLLPKWGLICGVGLILLLVGLTLFNGKQGMQIPGGNIAIATSTQSGESALAPPDSTQTAVLERPATPVMAPETATEPPAPAQTKVPENEAANPPVKLVIQAPLNPPIAQSPLALSVENAASARQIGAVKQSSGRIVQWSPDGKYLAAGAYGVFLYDAQTLELVREIGDFQWVYYLAFSPDGKTLAVAYDGLTLWNVESGGEVGSIEGMKEAGAMAFSPDGKQLAVAVGMVTKIVDLDSRKEIATLTAGSGSMQSNLAYSPDGQFLAVAGNTAEQEGQIIENKTGKTALGIKGNNTMNSLVYSADGQRLASTYHDGSIKIWNASTGLLERNLTGHTGPVKGAVFSPDGKLLASVSWDLTVRIWDGTSGQPLNVMSGHTGWILSVAFSPDGARIASCGEDEVVRIWGLAGAGSTGDTADKEQMNEINGLAFSRDGMLLASGGGDLLVHVWNLTDGSELTALSGASEAVNFVAFSPDGATLAAGAEGLRLYAVGE